MNVLRALASLVNFQAYNRFNAGFENRVFAINVRTVASKMVFLRLNNLEILIPLAAWFQILAIDSQTLDSRISHQEAIGILQKAKGTVDLVVASSQTVEANFKAAALEASSAAAAAAQAEREASTASIGSDWCQVR